ncbi:MAG: hypothetical protein SGARI_006347 [Bacillariaceae sp.]
MRLQRSLVGRAKRRVASVSSSIVNSSPIADNHYRRRKPGCENTRFSSTVAHNKTAHHTKQDRLLVVGSGVAGSAAALIAAETYQIPVTLLFAGNLPQDCNSWWAQGGIIYRNYDPASGDSAESLARDIHRAGAGLCEDEAVRKVSAEGPDRVRELLLTGGAFADVPFDKKPDGDLSLCLDEQVQRGEF